MGRTFVRKPLVQQGIVYKLFLTVAVVMCLALSSFCVSADPSSETETSTSCRLDENTLRQNRLQAIKSQILTKLGMSKPPNLDTSSESSPIPQDVMDTYEEAVKRRRRRQAEEDEDDEVDRYFGKRPSFIKLQATLGRHKTLGYTVSFKLQLQELPLRISANLTDIDESELQVNFNPSLVYNHKHNQPHQNHLHVELFQVLHSPSSENQRAVFLDGKVLDMRRKTVLSFDVTRALRQWLQPSFVKKTTTVELQITAHYSQADDATMQERFVDGLMQSLSSERERRVEGKLFVLSHSPTKLARRIRSHHRFRRQVLDQDYCTNHSVIESGTCCVEDLYIHFKEDLKWTWIVEPEGYYANLCQGSCPYMHAAETRYATVTSLYNHLNPTATAQPCCTANRLGSMHILYLDKQGRPHVEELENMIVQTCSCR